jgi:hypothetical protein
LSRLTYLVVGLGFLGHYVVSYRYSGTADNDFTSTKDGIAVHIHSIGRTVGTTESVANIGTLELDLYRRNWLARNASAKIVSCLNGNASDSLGQSISLHKDNSKGRADTFLHLVVQGATRGQGEPVRVNKKEKTQGRR